MAGSAIRVQYVPRILLFLEYELTWVFPDTVYFAKRKGRRFWLFRLSVQSMPSLPPSLCVHLERHKKARGPLLREVRREKGANNIMIRDTTFDEAPVYTRPDCLGALGPRVQCVRCDAPRQAGLLAKDQPRRQVQEIRITRAHAQVASQETHRLGWRGSSAWGRQAGLGSGLGLGKRFASPRRSLPSVCKRKPRRWPTREGVSRSAAQRREAEAAEQAPRRRKVGYLCLALKGVLFNGHVRHAGA